MTDSEIISHCLKNEIKVFPIREGNTWYFRVMNKGRPTTYRKRQISRGESLRETKEIHQRRMNIYKHWYEKIKN